MAGVLFLFYLFSFTVGFASTAMVLLSYIRYKSEPIRCFLFFTVIFMLHVVGIIVMFYLRVITGGYPGDWISRIYSYFIVVSFCVVCYSLFLFGQKYFRPHLTRLKKGLFSVLIFIVPQLVFSSSGVAERFEVDPKMSLLPFIVFSVGLFLLGAISGNVRDTGIGVKRRAALLIFVGLCTFMFFTLLDIIVLSGGATPNFSFTVSGYFIVSVLTLVAAFWVNSKQAEGWDKLPDAMLDRHSVSAREREIMSLILQGYSNQKIADSLYISLSTVKSHVYSVYQKLGIKSRAELFFIMQGNSDVHRTPESII
jgi:DNA-binding CsgD family transcriptional regulator